jgi:putative transcriptional regulator
MQRLRLKADGRIVELRDGQEFPLVPEQPALVVPTGPTDVRDLRRRARLTQQEFASKLGVPVETIRNWEQGKRMPRGPARALLTVIAHSPDTVFAALAREELKPNFGRALLGPADVTSLSRCRGATPKWD